MEVAKKRRRRVAHYPNPVITRVNDEQLELLDDTADAMKTDRATAMREALEIGVKRMQKKYGRTHE